MYRPQMTTHTHSIYIYMCIYLGKENVRCKCTRSFLYLGILDMCFVPCLLDASVSIDTFKKNFPTQPFEEVRACGSPSVEDVDVAFAVAPSSRLFHPGSAESFTLLSSPSRISTTELGVVPGDTSMGGVEPLSVP